MEEERLKEWRLLRSKILFEANPEIVRAIMAYTLRALMRGRTPNPEIARRILDKERNVPVCGQIECWIEGDHVH
jgi:hypothetical protein